MNNAMYVFKQEKEKYDALVANETDNFALLKLGNEYKEKAKRYLGNALAIINTGFDINYSLNKEGVGMTSSFKKINSLVRKSDDEVKSEMLQLKDMLPTLELSETQKEDILYAIEVIMVYCTDFGNPNAQIDQATSNVDVDVMKNNPKREVKIEEKVISETKKEKKYDEVVKGHKKDEPYIIYKLLVGIFVIPAITILAVVGYMFVSKYLTYELVTEYLEIGKGVYGVIMKVISILFAIAATSLISGFTSGHTNKELSFMTIPFVYAVFINMLISNYYLDIVSIIKADGIKDLITEGCQVFSYIMIIIPSFYYFFGIFKKHLKVSILDFLNILLFIYIVAFPGVVAIFESFNSSVLKSINETLYGFNGFSGLKYILYIIIIFIGTASSLLFARKMKKLEEN